MSSDDAGLSALDALALAESKPRENIKPLAPQPHTHGTPSDLFETAPLNPGVCFRFQLTDSQGNSHGDKRWRVLMLACFVDSEGTHQQHPFVSGEFFDCEDAEIYRVKLSQIFSGCAT